MTTRIFLACSASAPKAPSIPCIAVPKSLVPHDIFFLVITEEECGDHNSNSRSDTIDFMILLGSMGRLPYTASLRQSSVCPCCQLQRLAGLRTSFQMHTHQCICLSGNQKDGPAEHCQCTILV